MPSLFDYVSDVQTFMRDSRQDLVDPGDIIKWVNRARRETCMRTDCLRILTAVSGAIVSATVDDGGSNYLAPTITITPPDFPSGMGAHPNGDQATATAVVSAGAISVVNIDYGGAGYWQPTATITDSTGTGASITLNLTTQVLQLNQGQEVYKFTDADLAPFPGVDSIYKIQSVSLLYSGFRYSLACYDFSTYQALIRQWAQQWQYVPCVCAQQGQGTSGTFFMYPVPSQAYQMEWDCLCLPQDLISDQSDEAIPEPWTDAIAYWATHLGYLSIQNFNAAKYYSDMWKERVQAYSNAARPTRRTNPYGRWAGGF